jgi:rubrerythrin
MPSNTASLGNQFTAISGKERTDADCGKEHAKLYQNALDNLGHNAATDYFVCSVCGFTTTQLPAKNCPSCHNGVEKFLKIS